MYRHTVHQTQTHTVFNSKSLTFQIFNGISERMNEHWTTNAQWIHSKPFTWKINGCILILNLMCVTWCIVVCLYSFCAHLAYLPLGAEATKKKLTQTIIRAQPLWTTENIKEGKIQIKKKKFKRNKSIQRAMMMIKKGSDRIHGIYGSYVCRHIEDYGFVVNTRMKKKEKNEIWIYQLLHIIIKWFLNEEPRLRTFKVMKNIYNFVSLFVSRKT